MSQRPDRAKHTASKYDFVKVLDLASIRCSHIFVSAVVTRLQVKVWLGEGMTHYYVLSRFLISRMLTVTKIPYMKVSEAHLVCSAWFA